MEDGITTAERKSPVAKNDIDSVYEVKYGEISSFIFEFEDPLA